MKTDIVFLGDATSLPSLFLQKARALETSVHRATYDEREDH